MTQAKKPTPPPIEDLVPAKDPKGGLVFTSVSNVLKTRHDTAKNSIGN
jgi:hypothetical protein